MFQGRPSRHVPIREAFPPFLVWERDASNLRRSTAGKQCQSSGCLAVLVAAGPRRARLQTRVIEGPLASPPPGCRLRRSATPGRPSLLSLTISAQGSQVLLLPLWRCLCCCLFCHRCRFRCPRCRPLRTVRRTTRRISSGSRHSLPSPDRCANAL